MTQQECKSPYQFNIKTSKIGGGSFGAVYRTYDNVLDRECYKKASNLGRKESCDKL